MAFIYPIPTGRSSDMLVTRRLLMQLQAEQKRLLAVEQQLGTGRRIQLSSEDPSSASRAMSLQRMLETKAQLKVNLSTSLSFLQATDTALSSVAGLLSDARGLAVSAVDSTTSDLERQSMALELRATVRQLLDVANQQFRGRYLFAGSRSTEQPFDSFDDFVAYLGNNTPLRTYANHDMLLDTNVPGQELFGAVSAQMQGIDLEPILTADTRLADLRGGLGITRGTLLVSDGSHTSTVSIAGAETIGDVARLLESQPPAGREVRVTIGPHGLRVAIDAAGGGSLTIRDEEGGMTAAQLGILRLTGSASDPIVGTDLDPILRGTTPLSHILGVRARAVIRSPGTDNDIVLEAHQRGDALNGVTLQFVDHNLLQAAPGLPAGSEYAQFDPLARPAQAGIRLSGVDNDLILRANSAGTDWNNVTIQLDASADLGDAANVSYNAATKTLTIQVDDTDETTLGTLVAAIQGAGQFSVVPDPSRGEGYDATSAVRAADAGVIGNTGNSGGAANTIYVYIDVGDTTANQVVAALRANTDVAARFQVRLDPQDTSSLARAGSRTVSVTAQGTTAEGAGIEWDRAAGLQVTHGGQTYVIDVQAAETVEDLLNILNGSGAHLLATINERQNGISVLSRLSGADLAIGENGGRTATDLGIRTFALDTPLAQFNRGRGVMSVEGTDFVIRRSDGVELSIDTSSAQTVADILDLINHHPDNLDPNTAVTARLRAYGNGIELVEDHPGGAQTLQVRRTRVSTAAWDLGLIPRGEEVSPPPQPAEAAQAQVAFDPPHELNTALRFVAAQGGTSGNGVAIEFRNTLSGNAATATYDSGARRLIIDLCDGQTTANTVIDAVALEGTFRAELDTSGDPTNDGTGTLVAPAGVAATTGGGTPETLSGADTNPIETHGVFNSLIRLYRAVLSYDVAEIERCVEMLDDDFDRLNFGRAEVGSRSQAVEAITNRNEDEQVELKSVLSLEIDVDVATAASEFLARQAAYEASLRSMASLYRLTLLDFL